MFKWRRRKSLIDVISGNMIRPDPKRPPRVNISDKIFPIVHSSKN